MEPKWDNHEYATHPDICRYLRPHPLLLGGDPLLSQGRGGPVGVPVLGPWDVMAGLGTVIAAGDEDKGWKRGLRD